jgi:hypothetical protein
MEKGFVRLILIILIVVAALVVLKYVYNIDVVGFLTAGRFKELLNQLYNLGITEWQKYGGVLIKFWNYIIGFAKNIVAQTPKIK